jgi:type IV pilus assembly protein PilB
MPIDEKKIKDLLISQHYISAEEVAQAEKNTEKNTSTLRYLLDRGLLDTTIIGQAVSENYKVPFADLSKTPPHDDLIQLLPEQAAREYRSVVIRLEKDGKAIKKIWVATDDPERTGLLTSLQKILKTKSISLAYTSPENIDRVFSRYRKDLELRCLEILKHGEHIAPGVVDEIFSDAIIHHASDIHFEPRTNEVVVRFRIDGVLSEVGRFSHEVYDRVLNRIKVLAHVRIDSHATPQDGSISFSHDENAADLRVSIIPTLEGEKVTIRLLGQYIQGFSLTDLGLADDDRAKLLEAAQKPYGMILVTGPTGSGKTTTLYALLRLLNTPDINITTIEDPVEYRLQGVNQIQVNGEAGVTFARGLRSIVRQDPDIILVGEIRDEETAEISINAALTGHILLSTFHANDAATAIPRLFDMDVEPFLASSTIQIIIAQRLVRRLCQNCRVSSTIPLSELRKKNPDVVPFLIDITKNERLTLYQGKGCSVCKNSGYRGQIGVFELLPITKELREIILKRPSSQELWAAARKNGSKTLFEDGIEKVKNGVTTLEELLRVAQPPEK